MPQDKSSYKVHKFVQNQETGKWFPICRPRDQIDGNLSQRVPAKDDSCVNCKQCLSKINKYRNKK